MDNLDFSDIDDFRGALPERQESLWKIFEDILKHKRTERVANLDPKTELGLPDFDVRSCLNIALVADKLKFTSIKEFFEDKSEITTTTSQSKQGWLVELFVTKKAQDSRKSYPSPIVRGKWNPYQTPLT